MSTHINTINAIKGLTCATNCFKDIERYLNIEMQRHILHLTDAATEIDRLNNEVNTLRRELAKSKESISHPALDGYERIYARWTSIVEAIEATAAGNATLYFGAPIDTATEIAIAAINKTEADRKEALRTAEAFQRAQSKTEPSKDISLGWLNHHSFETPVYAQYVRLPRKATYEKFTQFNFISTEIINEAMRASEIHPEWPTDALHAVSILTEESGELMKAAIEFHYNNGDIEAVHEEAIQTGAMALRVLLGIDKYKRPSDEK
ncbi:nucleoside triphosphate pyrophosphohydrolase family protein [Yersinia frederiksenii]|uniref:hypothetical protein n=1 Tax=Yersinia frederiksenii TaxID=29484 RepID=UPI0011A86C93|nr:hypothetical protein [Yersinia frederiksenii]